MSDRSFDVDAWRRELHENRAEKDAFLDEHPQSPIAPEHREAFDGLAYFDPDPAYRVEATVTVHDDPEPIELETTAGPNVRYLQTVSFEFDLAGDTHTLSGYEQETADDEPIFVPFRDKTTGQQSYEKGRYMELTPTTELETGATVPIDFNLAYSPFCAFSDAFSCPLPPEENWLDCAIRAGERAPSFDT